MHIWNDFSIPTHFRGVSQLSLVICYCVARVANWKKIILSRRRILPWNGSQQLLVQIWALILLSYIQCYVRAQLFYQCYKDHMHTRNDEQRSRHSNWSFHIPSNVMYKLNLLFSEGIMDQSLLFVSESQNILESDSFHMLNEGQQTPTDYLEIRNSV